MLNRITINENTQWMCRFFEDWLVACLKMVISGNSFTASAYFVMFPLNVPFAHNKSWVSTAKFRLYDVLFWKLWCKPTSLINISIEVYKLFNLIVWTLTHLDRRLWSPLLCLVSFLTSFSFQWELQWKTVVTSSLSSPSSSAQRCHTVILSRFMEHEKLIDENAVFRVSIKNICGCTL